MLRSENRDAMHATGRVIWFDARPEVLSARINSDSENGQRRPSLTDRDMDEEVRQLMKQREPIYRETSDLRLDVSDVSLEDIVDRVVAFLRMMPQ